MGLSSQQGFVVDLRIIKALVWRCERLVFSLDIPSNFSPLTKLPAAFYAEWSLRFRSKGLIWKCWSCIQTRGCYETMSFVWHTIAFQPRGNSLNLHRTGITFMSSDTEGNRVTNFSKSLHTFSSCSPFLSSGLSELLDWDIISYSFKVVPSYFHSCSFDHGRDLLSLC